MSDTLVVVLSVAAFAGALSPTGTPLWVGLAMAAAAVGLRAPMLVPLAALVLCSSLAQRSWDGLEASDPTTLRGRATVVTDPERFGAATSAVVRVDGRRYLATGFGGAGAVLGRAEAGHVVTVEGRVVPYQGRPERRAALHVADRLRLDAAQPVDTGNALWRTANGLRSLVSGGAERLGERRRVLFTGLVFGDDRGQDPGVEADFRQAGLTHLLAVSGQNVAYVLALMRPVSNRLPRGRRWLLTMVVLLVFATLTRFEPSVLRATAMAAIAVSARSAGRATTTLRNLALAITALLVIDPLLAETVAFRLSVAASAGIVVLEPRIRAALPGPEALRSAVAVTLAAQLAVAPLLVTTFGPMSVVSLPANVLAGPLAGGLMAWGMTAGVLAGVMPPLAVPVHAITTLALWLLETVARTSASAPVAPVGLDWLAAAVALAVGRHWWRSLPGGSVAGVGVAVALVLGLQPRVQAGAHPVGHDSVLVVAGGHVVLEVGDEYTATDLIVDIRRLGVRHVDVVVAEDPGHAVASLHGRVSVGATATPDD